MKNLLAIFLLFTITAQINAQHFIDTYIHIKPDYYGGIGELLIMDCHDPLATVSRTVTFEGNPLPGMQATGIIASGPKTLHYQANDGTNTYEFVAEIDFNGLNPTISYTTSPTIEPMSVIEKYKSASPACDGEIELIISGGNAPISTKWFDENGSEVVSNANQLQFSGLCANTYGYSFGDASTFTCLGAGNGFSNPFNVTIDLLDCIVQTTDVSCVGTCDGSAELITVGGLGIMNSFITHQNGNNHPLQLTNECSGNVHGEFMDFTGAIAQCMNDIGSPDLINFTLNTTDLTGPGSNDGTAEVSVTQGAAPITYEWTGPNSYNSTGTNQVNGLEDGAYDLTMTYNNGQCDTTTSFQIYDALQIIISSVEPHTVNPPNGAVYFSIAGGKEPYDTILDDGQNQISGGPFTGLSFGQYTLIVNDANGNSVDSTFMINTFVSVNKEALNEFTIYPNPATNNISIKGDYLISATFYDLNGRIVLTTNLNENQTQSINVSNLEAGIYTVSLRSEKGEHMEKVIIK
ncbi:T9SS type A sorting domain-containing protein [Brumimicrobium salinarum]|nr:T9SS type A sorting domain-containing protein [Brumimicrobium salinarum]